MRVAESYIIYYKLFEKVLRIERKKTKKAGKELYIYILHVQQIKA
jgi:hypothetical protein